MAEIQVTVVLAVGPRALRQWQGTLPEGSCAHDALMASGLVEVDAGLDLGIWGRKVRLADPLQQGDRVEIYRPLAVDPKVARRERFAKQGSRKSGLFAHKQPKSPK